MYENLIIECENLGLTIKEIDFPDKIDEFQGLTIDETIYINKTLSTQDKYTTLAEELMHVKYSAGNILDQRDINNRKDELKARGKSYEKILPLTTFIELFEKHITSKTDIEERLSLDWSYIEKAINHYKQKYGMTAQLGDYTIYFYPNLAVLKLRR